MLPFDKKCVVTLHLEHYNCDEEGKFFSLTCHINDLPNGRPMLPPTMDDEDLWFRLVYCAVVRFGVLSIGNGRPPIVGSSNL